MDEILSLHLQGNKAHFLIYQTTPQTPEVTFKYRYWEDNIRAIEKVKSKAEPRIKEEKFCELIEFIEWNGNEEK